MLATKVALCRPGGKWRTSRQPLPIPLFYRFGVVIQPLKAFMRPVTKWAFAGFLAGAHPCLTSRIGFVAHRQEFRTLVRAIAVRLLAAFTTGAPEVGFALFQFDLDGGGCCYCRLCHDEFSLLDADFLRVGE